MTNSASIPASARKGESAAPKETTGWFQRELVLSEVPYPEAVSALKSVLAQHGFSIRRETPTPETLKIEAMFGSRWRAFVLSFVPYIGRHIPAGKRFFLTAAVRPCSEGICATLNITPYMELINCEEIMPISQTPDEKLTDEYFAASLLFQVIQALFTTLNREVPEEFRKLDMKPFAKDAFWRLLLYPLDGFKSRKPVYLPPERGPFWCWGGFILPEIWFLWHEIWGASIFAIMIELLVGGFFPPEVGAYGMWAGIIGVRLAAAIYGHRIYYCRYGSWLNEKK